MKKKYVVRYERGEDGWWLATVLGIKGCHTQGRTIEEAEREAREALSVCVDDPIEAENAVLERDVKLPAAISAELRALVRARRSAEVSTATAQRLLRKVVTDLQGTLDLSVRDVATLVGLSHQRVHQLVAD